MAKTAVDSNILPCGWYPWGGRWLVDVVDVCCGGCLSVGRLWPVLDFSTSEEKLLESDPVGSEPWPKQNISLI